MALLALQTQFCGAAAAHKALPPELQLADETEDLAFGDPERDIVNRSQRVAVLGAERHR